MVLSWLKVYGELCENGQLLVEGNLENLIEGGN